MSDFRLLFVFFILISSEISFAQVGINTDNSDPDASAILDVKSTEKGMLIPRMTSTQRDMISNAAIGLLVFDITTETFWFNDSGGWTELVSGGTSTEIADADGDTKIQVEESADEDLIRFDVGGEEALVVAKNTNGDTRLDIPGSTIKGLFMGKNAGRFNAANNNTGIGHLALNELTSGGSNTALGNVALKELTNGFSNTAIGFGTLINSTTGAQNTAIGAIALGDNATGIRNTAIGHEAGRFASGDQNIFLGYFAGRNASGNNKLYIENSDSNSPLIYGEFDNDLLRVNGTLNVNNAFSFPSTDGTANQVLQTDGSGTLAWTDVAAGTQTLIEDADMDTKIQVEESADEDLIRFDVGGTQAAILQKVGNGGTQLTFSGNSNNIILGSSTINSLNGANNNTIMGSNAFLNATDGTYNTATGAFALWQNTSGSNNNVFGSGALQNNTTGSENIAIGNAAGWTNQTGSDNIFIGNAAGYGGGVGTGARNVMIGKSAGEANSGSGNVFLGYQAGRSSSGSDKLFIDNSSTSSPLIYGEFNTNLLRVNGTFNINNAFSFPTTDGTANQVLQTDGSGTLAWADVAAGTQTLIEDADMDTKIQVEESANEDVIRFDIAGLESATLERTTAGRTLLTMPNNENNIMIGSSAGGGNTATDGRNVFIGNSAGQSSSTGKTNVAIGHGAGVSVQDGNSNVFIGAISGSGASGAENSIFIGKQAGFQADNTASSVMIGSSAGSFSSGPGNIFIGNRAGEYETDGNRLYIHNTFGTPLIYGEFDNDLLRINGDLEVTGTFPGSDDQNIDVLNLNGNTLEISLEDDGQATQTLDLSTVTPKLVTDTDGDTRVELEATPDEDQIKYFFDSALESFRFESDKFTLQSLSTNSPELHFQAGVTNKIVNINPIVINPNANSYRMEFYVNDQKNLALLNDQSVRISDSYKLPTDAGTVGEALVTDGNGDSSWQNVGVPIGSVQMWPTDTPPTGWIICDGSDFNAGTYPALAAILGSTTLPDFNGRMPLGVGESDEDGATNHLLNSTGGEETHVLTINEMPAHNHEILYREGSENGSGNDYSDLGDTGVTGDTTESAGGNLPHNNMPPYFTINFIIKAE